MNYQTSASVSPFSRQTMNALTRMMDSHPLDPVHLGNFQPPDANVDHGDVPVGLCISATNEDLSDLIHSAISKTAKPHLSIAANEFRAGPDRSSIESFRRKLLRELRQQWTDPSATEARFIRLVELVQRDGCAVFAGLIDTEAFKHLIRDFSALMDGIGTRAFLHSFANLIEHPDFVKNKKYNDAIIHPLVIAVIAYVMGGPIRMTDVRGKDTEPIAVNAQDNMLHVDNTPFKEKYKILLGWEKGKVRGPTGQNFTFLPGTQKGNRSIRLGREGTKHDAAQTSQPWSTENDSLFITEESIQGVFQFQRDVTGISEPRVIEVEYPAQPVTVLFNAGSLVHHRYRNKAGNPRSCVIAAFHLASDHPGTLIRRDRDHCSNPGPPKTLADMLMRHQSGSTNEIDMFCSLLSASAQSIEDKINHILVDSHPSTLVDTTQLALTGEKLARWREIVIHEPSATALKFERRYFLSSSTSILGDVDTSARFHERGGEQNTIVHVFTQYSTATQAVVEIIASAMSYDKHGLLDLIMYADGHEEVRKPARKSIYTMSKDALVAVVNHWVPVAALFGYRFGLGNLEKPAILRDKADRVAELMLMRKTQTPGGTINAWDKLGGELTAAHQLIVDLGESITRCESLETSGVTCLFLFLIVDRVMTMMGLDHDLDSEVKEGITSCGVVFLRSYLACVLASEKMRYN